jgi:hypothetical protein
MRQSEGRYRRTFVALILAAASAVAVSVAAGALDARSSGDELTVHEWGTFTSVAGPDGGAIPWQPLSSPSDLPCFVQMLPDSPKFDARLVTTRATVRMETPVLYFYSPHEMTVDVGVRFPQGLITEWYPRALVQPGFTPPDLMSTTAQIAWSGVRVMPGAKAEFPTEAGKSHYYAARDTDASPVQVGGQVEKFLFYRGIASFPVPLAAKVTDAGTILVENTSRYDLGPLVLFENRGGRLGYRLIEGLHGRTFIDPPALTGSVEALGADLEKMLIAHGLYPREAKAMVATWRDSWFEEGARLFYVLPQAAVDAILPLQIYPKPAQVARAFVSRLEIVTPAVQDDVQRAFAKNDMVTLNKYARFLEPIAWRIIPKAPAGLNPARLQAVQRLIAASHVPEVPCR